MRAGVFLLAAAILALCACDAATPIAPQAATGTSQLLADFPSLSGRVVDQASLLSPEQESRLIAMLEQLEARTTDQLVVVTVPSLKGRSIEDYSLELGRFWGIGQAGKDNGVLLVLAPSERRTRIEVGYGLEPILTNQRAQEIIDRDLLPHFRDDQWFEGIETATRAIAGILIDNAAVPRRGHR